MYNSVLVRAANNQLLLCFATGKPRNWSMRRNRSSVQPIKCKNRFSYLMRDWFKLTSAQTLSLQKGYRSWLKQLLFMFNGSSQQLSKPAISLRENYALYYFSGQRSPVKSASD